MKKQAKERAKDEWRRGAAAGGLSGPAARPATQAPVPAAGNARTWGGRGYGLEPPQPSVEAPVVAVVGVVLSVVGVRVRKVTCGGGEIREATAAECAGSNDGVPGGNAVLRRLRHGRSPQAARVAWSVVSGRRQVEDGERAQPFWISHRTWHGGPQALNSCANQPCYDRMMASESAPAGY